MRLYLKNLPPHTTRDEMVKYLEGFGRLTEFKIIKSETFGASGFVQYDSAEDARFVLNTFRDKLFLGHRTVIELARPLRKDMPYTESHPNWRTTRSLRHSVQAKYYSNRAHPCRYPVLVDNIPPRVCWQELKDFGRLAGGAVAFCDLDPSGSGCGFIEYFSREDAEEAIELLNGQTLAGGVVRVSVSRTARHRSRSRSPIARARRSYRVPDAPPQATGNEPPLSYVLPTSTSRYFASRRSSELSSDRFTSHLYSDDSALHPVSQTVESYQKTVARGAPPGMLQTSTSTDSTEFGTSELPAPTHILANDYYDFDAYLRLSYDHRFHVGTGFIHDGKKENAVYGPQFGGQMHS
ncbi:hypothetical protein K438DRAFT_27951 [Mycena galopus ATCC 62051]|nr:hypothetical protein K438DRAFT_27951 [Mycena galopus ATCC 62051]